MTLLKTISDRVETLISGQIKVSPLLALPVLSSILLAWLLLQTIRQYWRLRHIPGPFSTGFSKLWLLRSVMTGRMNLQFYEANEKYGPIVRIAPNEVLTSDPKFLKHILAVRSPYQKSDWYLCLRFNPERDNLLTLLNDDDHTKLRAKMAAGYSGREIDSFEARIDRNILALVDLINKNYVSKERVFDFGRKAQYFTLDALSDIAFGQAFGFLISDSDIYDYIKTMEKQLPAILVPSVYPWTMAVLSSPLFKRLLPSRHDALGFGRVMGIAQKTVAERFGPDKKVQRDMLGSFIAHGLNQEEAESEVLLQMVAGSDTTATAIRATVLYIITNRRVFNSLRAELDRAGISSRTWNSIISNAESLTLSYLQAVVKEGLRIWPPIASPIPKAVPPGGDSWDGFYLPEGTKVGYCAWGVSRRKEVWGEDANEFRPERWLEATPEKLREMDSTLDLLFGLGRWKCLGKGVALMQVNKVLVELFRRFDFAIVDPTHPWKSWNTGLFLQSEFWIRATKRQL